MDPRIRQHDVCPVVAYGQVEPLNEAGGVIVKLSIVDTSKDSPNARNYARLPW